MIVLMIVAMVAIIMIPYTLYLIKYSLPRDPLEDPRVLRDLNHSFRVVLYCLQSLL